MGNCTSLKTGESQELYISDTDTACAMYQLPTYPTRRWAIPSAGASTAAGANSVNLGTIPAALTSLYIPAGMWIGFVNQTTGAIIPVKLTAVVNTSSTSISCEATPAAIPASTPFYWPVPIGGITSVTSNDNTNVVTGESTDANGFASAAIGITSGTMEIAYEVDDTDPGQLNLEYFRTVRGTCVISLYDPEFKTFIQRKFTRGIGVVGAKTTTRPRNTQITGNTTFTFTQAPSVTIGKAA